MIRFACSHCQAPINAPPQAAGTRAKCPKCSLLLEIPVPKGQIAPELPAGMPPLPSVPQPQAEPSGLAENPANPKTFFGIDTAWIARESFASGTAVLIIGGILAVLYFAAIYDTTVPQYAEYADYPGTPRIYNIGRMQNRWVGIAVGFGCGAAGIALAVIRKMKKQ